LIRRLALDLLTGANKNWLRQRSGSGRVRGDLNTNQAAIERVLQMLHWVGRRRNGSDIFGGVFGQYPSHFPMYWKEIAEFSFYFVETFALPFAVLVFVFERRKERLAEEEELNQRLSDEYIGFLKLVLDNADLQLLRRHAPLRELSEEQEERRFALFGILVSIFEGAYILVYEERLSRQTRRLWSSWEDYMREWCRRPEFRKALPELLEGEDPDFRSHIESIAKEFSG
jgi:hypothetical protein